MEDSDPKPPASSSERRHGALLHLLVVLMGLALPYAYYQSRSTKPFIKHHGHQATLLMAIWLLIVLSHFVIAKMLHGLETMQHWMYLEMGISPDPRIVSGIELTLEYNILSLWLEGAVIVALGFWMARNAWLGQYKYFFFAKPK